MGNKVQSFLEDKVVPIATKIGNQRHIKAISDALVITIPLTIIGSISLLIASPPVDPTMMKPTNFFFKMMLAWYEWAVANNATIMIPFQMTMGIMALFVAVAVAYFLAREYRQDYPEIDPLSSAIISGVVFLMLAAPAQEGAIPVRFLDAKGFFTAMIVGAFTVEITRLLVKNNIRIKMPEGVPPAVSASFSSLIPMIVNIGLFFGLNLISISVGGVSIPQLIINILTPVLNGTDSVWFVVIMMFISHILWTVGIHGGSVTGSITSAVYTSNLAANAAAKAAGESLPYVMTAPLSVYIVVMGGAGATLGLMFMMLRSRSKQLRTVARVGLLPGLFGINEPILFGTPMILNPIMAIPLVITPLVNAFLGFYATKWGLVGRAFIGVPWTTPPFIGLPLATMDFRAFFLVVFVLIIDMIIYYPFFKMYEKTLVEREEMEITHGK